MTSQEYDLFPYKDMKLFSIVALMLVFPYKGINLILRIWINKFQRVEDCFVLLFLCNRPWGKTISTKIWNWKLTALASLTVCLDCTKLFWILHLLGTTHMPDYISLSKFPLMEVKNCTWLYEIVRTLSCDNRKRQLFCN